MKTFVLNLWNRKAVLAAAFLLAGMTALADDLTATNADVVKQLGDMDINQLLQVKVSIIGRSEAVAETPAAVSVVTQDDIKRSGAMNIPEALRLVPGMDVAQVDASQWAVSARGFNDTFANKLLVMQDGRSIYTPLFSGVFWDVQGTMMEDIDHIEVVRGPGATLWGANAMNGVINILTKSAADTQGLLVSGGGGNQDRGFGEARYGGTLTSNVFYRVYGTYENHDANELPNGSDADDSWQLARGGFRMDANPEGANAFTFQGDGYAGNIDQVFGLYDPSLPPTYTITNQDLMRVSGANALGRWTHTISDTANIKLQAYYDYTDREIPDVFSERFHIFDVDFKNEFALGDRNQIVWGLGYRLISDREKNSTTISFNPDSDTLSLFSAFVQDEVAIIPRRLSFTFGSKLEHNDFTDFEVEPGARLLWTPAEHQTFWGSISRAVRTPSRAEEAITITQARELPSPPYPPGAFAPISLLGTSGFESEDLVAYELGYRTEPCDKLSIDLAAYYNDYDNLRSQQQNLPTNPLQYYLANDLHGRTYGFEASATWRVLDWWRLQPAYTMLKMNLYAQPDGTSPADQTSVDEIEGTSPQNQFSLRSSTDLPHGVTFDTALRYVDNLPYFHIESYFELDARLAWKINKKLEISLVGQNLLHDRHAEFGPSYINTQAGQVTDIPRSFYARLTWTF